MALLFAFSIQDQVEKYGAYVGLAAFFGLAVLTVLYFAQARELKRLRDWAGRAPERAQELEARVVAQADELRRGPAAEPEPVAERSGTVGPAQPVAKPAAAPSGNGRGTGMPAPIPPGPRPAVAVAAAAQAQAAVAAPEAPAEEAEAAPGEASPAAPGGPAPAAADAPSGGTPDAPSGGAPDAAAPAAPGEPSPAAPDRPSAAAPGEPSPAAPEGPPTELHPAPEPEDVAESEEEPESEPEEAPASGGNGVATPPPSIPRATPRPQPRPAPAAQLRSSASRSTTVPPRRGTAAPARRDNGGSSRAGRITLITLGGIVGLAVVVFGAMQILGGGDGSETKPPANQVEQPTATPGGGNAAVDVADQRPDTVVVVLNGTATDGLAGSLGDKLAAEGYSEDPGMIRTGNNTDQQRQDSLVLYAPGKRRMARDVAQILGITTRPEAIDEDTLALANNTGDSAAGHETDVVVVAGADQAS